jgi:serine/threonine-protein kinase
MTPERWQRIKSLLESVLEREPQERAVFLKQACADDPALQSEVESLIASHEQAGGFIELPAFELMAESLGVRSESLVGRSFGPYQIISAIGSGGMGEVYLAEDPRLGRKIALKVLPTYYTSDDERVGRFQQEARAASALNHPSIITIYEIGEVDSRHFIVTEFIDGETLRRRMAKSQLTVPEALRIAIHTASALAAAHAGGIVHRDIKPENIMLREDGIVKVLDFGLAKLTDRKNDVAKALARIETQQGMVMGTSYYMSPEQARGLTVDSRTDIWSLGVVLYEMIAGQVPFKGGTSSDVIASILNNNPLRLARYAPDIPPELEWIVEKTLRKDREERYQTAKELLTDLKRLKRRLEFVEDLDHSDGGQRSAGLAARSHSDPYEASHAKAQSQGSQSHNVIDSLAILPLANASADPAMEYLSDGITESIINALSQLAELRVMAWSTVSRYKGKELDPREFGRELGVRAVVTGRVMQLGEDLVIKTELVDAVDGSHLWGESYSCKPSQILDIQEEISSTISEKLLLRLTTEERRQLKKHSPDNVEAYHAYLRGRYFWNKRSEEGLKKGIEYFQQAIEADPSYAAAYAGISDCYTILVVRYGLAPAEGIPKAKAAAIKALEIDDTLAEAHTSLAHSLLHNWEWEKAEKEFKRALELNPNDANAHNFYAEYLRAMGRVEQALKVAKRAQELDPLSLNHSTNVANDLYFARRYDEAIAQCQKALEMDRNFFLAHYRLGQAYEQKGMFAEAITAMQRAVELSPDNIEMLGALGRVLAVAGRREEARRIVDQLEEGVEHRHSWHFDIALIYAGLGENDQAFEYLEKGYEWRDGMMIHLNVEPRCDSLRSDPRFQDLVGRMGLASPYQGPPEGHETVSETKASPQNKPAALAVLPLRPTSTEGSDEILEPGIADAPITELSDIAPAEPHPGTPASEAQETSTEPKPRDEALEHHGPSKFWLARTGKIFLILAFVALLAGVGYLVRRSPRTIETSSLSSSTFTQLTDLPGAELFPSLSPDGKSLVYSSRASGNWDIYLQPVGGRTPIDLTKDSSADDTQPAFSPDGQRIAFRSDRDGGGIYLMGAAGESVSKVSDFGYSPSWSSDGKQILIGTEKIPQPSTRPSRSQLWTINIESGERRLLSDGDALQPSCSPHKQRIAFWSRSSRAGQREAISTIPFEGGDAVPITDGSTTDLSPVWSPDGKYLYFSSNRGGSLNIWRVAIDEKSGAALGEPQAVTTIGAATSAHYLSFSSDGRHLAYVTQEDIRNLRKAEFDPASGKVGSEPVSITRGSMQLWFPDVSPDGEWLTACSRGQNRHVFVLRTDGTDLRDLTDDNYRNDGWSRWSPDGKRIVFTSRRSGDYELWLINRDGSGLQRLTQSSGGHYSAWSRDGSMIAYSIHQPKNECVIIHPDKNWSEQQPEHLPALSDPTLSFEGWSWSPDGKKLAGIRHLPNGVHSGIGIYDRQSKTYDWLTDFGDWPVWFNDGQRLLFVSQGKIFLFDTRTRKYQPVLTVTDQDVDIGSPALSPDNRTIYFTYVAAEADVWLMTLK